MLLVENRSIDYWENMGLKNKNVISIDSGFDEPKFRYACLVSKSSAL